MALELPSQSEGQDLHVKSVAELRKSIEEVN